jgi:NAD(P)-dependent dehydrogenase (short-subunit alcohol dehydrogenase family)
MKTVLITGGARRIGAAMATALAADGWLVIAHYHRSAADAESLAATINAAGGQCVTVQADLSDPADVAGLIPRCVAQWGAPDALINNASSFTYDTIESMTQASWDAHMAPNLAAPVFLAQAFAHALGEKSGCIVNMLDHKLTALNPDFFSYTVAKAGLEAATRMLALAFGGRIRACGIAPGITLISGKQTPAGFTRAWSATPLGRSSTPDDLAEAARFILATGSLNGQVLVLDGGDSLLQRKRDVAFGG